LAVIAAEVATPLEFVVAVMSPPAKVALAPDPGAENVTVTPLTGLLPLSRTVTCKALPNAVLMMVLCPEPLVAVTEAGVPDVLVRVNDAGLATPVALAVTVYEPSVELAVKAFEVAMPEALVTAVLEVVKAPLAPEPGGVKVTVTPLIGLLPASLTVACSGTAKAVLIIALCPEPEVTVIVAAGPGVLVRANRAGVPTPLTDALML
jgi:hypothetical protein